MLGQGLCYQPSLAFYVQARVLCAAFPLWARSPITILPYMSVRSEPRRESTLVQCSTDSPEYLSAPDTVHVSLTAAAGDRLGYHKVGAPKIKWTVALLIMLAQVRPALGVIDTNPFLHEALASCPARPDQPYLPSPTSGSAPLSVPFAELLTTPSSAPCTGDGHVRSDNCKALTLEPGLPRLLFRARAR